MVRAKLGPSVHLIVIVSLMTGCESRDQRLSEFAERATAQQARQNEAMARQSEQVTRQSQELAQAAHELVEQDATARRELIQAHERAQDQLQERQAGLDLQRQELHVERTEAAQAAVRDPVIAQALIVTGLILATLLPLIVTAYALRRLPDPSPGEALLAHALLDDLAPRPTEMPLPRSPDALPAGAPAPRIPGPGGVAADPAAPPGNLCS